MAGDLWVTKVVVEVWGGSEQVEGQVGYGWQCGRPNSLGVSENEV